MAGTPDKAGNESGPPLDGNATPENKVDTSAKRMTRTEAVTLLRRANQPFDEKMDAKEIIKMAKALPVEKYYTIVLQEKEDVKAPAYIGVCGRPWHIARGEEVVVPGRVVEALKNAVSFVPYQEKDPMSPDGKMLIKHKRINAELYSVLGEAQAP